MEFHPHGRLSREGVIHSDPPSKALSAVQAHRERGVHFDPYALGKSLGTDLQRLFPRVLIQARPGEFRVRLVWIQYFRQQNFGRYRSKRKRESGEDREERT